jgi:serine-aspartate repeat-containing protein C/D/E
VGLFSNLLPWPRRRRSHGKRLAAHSEAKLVRHCKFEAMEPRRLLSGDAIELGTVYIEEDLGSDLHGDHFMVQFAGGAAGTELTRLIINCDRGAPGFDMGDLIFDTLPTGRGADLAAGFQIEQLISSNSSARVEAHVNDGESILVLDFSGFRAGDKLVFSIDVDEVQWYDPSATDVQSINEGIDPITSGVEFQGSLLTASFVAPHYLDAEGSVIFWNRYDDKLQASGLDLPEDDVDGKRDRTAGAFLTVPQVINPVSISGYVYADDSNDGIRDPGEQGLAGITVRVIPVDTVAPQQTVTLVTDARGYYEATNVSPGTYRIVELQQPAAYLDGLDTAGTVSGVTRGTAVNPGDNIENIFLGGGARGIEYNFGEISPASIDGSVHLSDSDGNCYATSTTCQPLSGVIVRLSDGQGNLVAETRTDTFGKYAFAGLIPGLYTLIEITPAGLIDAEARAGTVDNHVRGQVLDANTIANIQLGAGDQGHEYEFCEHLPSSISGYVYHDRNNNGQREAGEESLAAVTVTLRDQAGNSLMNTQTNAQGFYQFTNLSAGTYQLAEAQPSGWLDGKDTVGKIDGLPCGTATTNDVLSGAQLRWGSTGADYNFGELRPSSLEGLVYADIDRDGIFDPIEHPITGVRIELLNDRGSVVATTYTNSVGDYRFEQLVPGVYAVRETQPDGYFQGSQVAGSRGGDASVPDLITRIPIGSGEHLTDYDFCELPPASISGYVFQDGPALETRNGLVPDNVTDIRDGLRTPDDRPIGGVVMELRDGWTGEAILADQALPGAYGVGPLTAITDAHGFYQFHSLPPGSYAVYEVHPARYTDSIDTAGTTSGIPFNVDSPELDEIIRSLAKDPAHDAIVRIPLLPGQASLENNFSEVLVERTPIPPQPPPPVPLRSTPYVLVTPPTLPWNLAPMDEPRTMAHVPVYGAAGVMPMTWHLSVVDGGSPRGDSPDIDPSQGRWRTVAYMNRTQWISVAMHQGYWTMPAALSGTHDGAGDLTFGIPGAIPFSGDFDGDGLSEVGVYHEGQWFIDLNGNGRWDEEDLWAQLGTDEDLPVVGDWDGDGKDDIGIFGPEWRGDDRAIAAEPGLPDPQNDYRRQQREIGSAPKNLPPEPAEATDGRRVLKRTAEGMPREDVIDHVFRFGIGVDLPVAGDWNGDGIRSIGVFRAGTWLLDLDGDGRHTHRDAVVHFGADGDLPVVGDFNADGIDEIGVYRKGTWYLDSNGNRELDARDQVFQMGGATDLPVVGDWDGDGRDDPAVYRDAG